MMLLFFLATAFENRQLCSLALLQMWCVWWLAVAKCIARAVQAVQAISSQMCYAYIYTPAHWHATTPVAGRSVPGVRQLVLVPAFAICITAAAGPVFIRLCWVSFGRVSALHHCC